MDIPHRPHPIAGGLEYQVLNGQVGCLLLFKKPADCAAFETMFAVSRPPPDSPVAYA